MNVLPFILPEREGGGAMSTRTELQLLAGKQPCVGDVLKSTVMFY